MRQDRKQIQRSKTTRPLQQIAYSDHTGFYRFYRRYLYGRLAYAVLLVGVLYVLVTAVHDVSQPPQLHTPPVVESSHVGGVGSVASNQAPVAIQHPSLTREMRCYHLDTRVQCVDISHAGIQNPLFSWLLNNAVISQFSFVFITPATLTYENPTVIVLYNYVLMVAYAASGVVIALGAMNLIVGKSLGTSYEKAMVFLPRLVMAVTIATFGRFGIGLFIEANNALIASIPIVSGATILNPVSNIQGSNLPELLMGLLYLLLVIIVIFQMWYHIVMVNVWLIVFPFVVVWGKSLLKYWMMLFSIIIFIQFFQVLAMSVAIDIVMIFFSPGHQQITILIMAGSAIWFVIKVPVFISDHSLLTLGSMINAGERGAGPLRFVTNQVNRIPNLLSRIPVVGSLLGELRIPVRPRM